jgi:hypothetical protein
LTGSSSIFVLSQRARTFCVQDRFSVDGRYSERRKRMRIDQIRRRNRAWLLPVLGLFVLLMSAATAFLVRPALVQAVENSMTYLPLVNKPHAPINSAYVIIGWNDLGMHCYDRDYATSAVLPPYNNLWAQVIKRGNPPQVVANGVVVEYSFPGNTYSVGKTNFWDYAEKLFGLSLAPNVGLKGKGMSGQMDPVGNHFEAEGVPVTEFSDSNPGVADYYQMAKLVAKDPDGKILATTDIVAPVSSEMRCDVCHNAPSPTDFRMNILMKHDELEGTALAAQATGGNPVLCANCHADPALGKPGAPGVSSLSAAMHGRHQDKTSDCYACHPGPLTRCLRDVMAVEKGMTCVDCHTGGMAGLANINRTPWVDLPRCGSCHEGQFSENPGKLYKVSTGHGGLYCESCHNSTHAILKSREEKDNRQAIALQGEAGTIKKCTICHLTEPSGEGPHH